MRDLALETLLIRASPSPTAARTTPLEGDRADAVRAASGDVQAFERLYRAHVARVHSLVRRMAGTDEADSLTQDVFVRAWRKLHLFRGESAFSTWLHRLAVNVALEWMRSTRYDRLRHRDPEAVLAVTAGRPARPDVTLDYEAALERLPDGAREVFVLHDVDGYKHGEIAALLGISAGTSKAQLHRARMLMRRFLTQD